VPANVLLSYVVTHSHYSTLISCFNFSAHPYIIFNKDKESLTFVGFKVSADGDLVDPTQEKILERNIITSDLCKWFKRQGVDFNDDYSQWTKQDMITKLSTVMVTARQQQFIGLQNLDDSYVLTVDNVTKILAIQMRFRYVI
jgi:hypothetical protein